MRTMTVTDFAVVTVFLGHTSSTVSSIQLVLGSEGGAPALSSYTLCGCVSGGTVIVESFIDIDSLGVQMSRSTITGCLGRVVMGYMMVMRPTCIVVPNIRQTLMKDLRMTL